jgi:hypothetical protein
VHALTLAAVGVWCFLVALTGALLGLVLGNIRLPLFLLVGTNPAAAAGANIAVSGVAAATAASVHVRARRFDRRLVAWMLPPSIGGAVGGSIAAGYLPAEALRIVIGSALLAFGIDLLRPRLEPVPPPRETLDLRAAVASGAVIGALGSDGGARCGGLRSGARHAPAARAGANPLVLGVDDEALGEGDLPLPPAQPALRLVEQALDLAVLACDAGNGDSRALPDVVMVDLRDRCADAVLQLRLGRAKVVPLLLQRVRARKVQLAREDADEAARHQTMISDPSKTMTIFELNRGLSG